MGSKNQIKNAQSKRFDKDNNVNTKNNNTTLYNYNISDDSDSRSAGSNGMSTSSSDNITHDSSSNGDSLFRVNDKELWKNSTININTQGNAIYFATAPAPPCDPDLLVTGYS